MSEIHHHQDGAIEDTVRIEAFSDGVFAIITTLLILDLHVPVMEILTTQNFLTALQAMVPQFIAFTFSFLTLAIFWVNHHHFFHGVEKTDWKLLWYNNLLLFCLALIPFATAFIGRYYTSVVPVAVYSLVMMASASAMMLMIRYVFFHSQLMFQRFPESYKHSEFRRGMWGVYLYAGAVAGSFISVYITLLILVVTPILFVVPRLFSEE